MKIKLISLMIASSYLLGCTNNTNKKAKEPTKSLTQEESQHNIETQTLELNNGEKWKINAEMMPSIKNMEKNIKNFSFNEHHDYNVLAEKLQEDIGDLTSSCTMKGKPHDELHKWLLPYIGIVKELSETKDEIEAAKQFKNIQISINTFNQYFE